MPKKKKEIQNCYYYRCNVTIFFLHTKILQVIKNYWVFTSQIIIIFFVCAVHFFFVSKLLVRSVLLGKFRNSILFGVNAMFFENFVGLIQLPVTFLNVPVSNLLEFILGSKAERYKAKKKKKRTHWDRFWGKNISCLFFIIPFSLWAKYLQRDTLNQSQFPWPMFERIY